MTSISYFTIRLRLTFLLLALLCLHVTSMDIQFKHVNTTHGLNSNNVTSILQDKLGFIWFGTVEGLCRYDGNSCLNFIHLEDDTTTLSNNNIMYMLEDKKGNFWIGTRNGLNYFDITTYRVKRMPPKYSNTLGKYIIKHLCLSSNDVLYISTESHALYALDLKDMSLQHYTHDPEDSTTIISNNISGVEEGVDHNIWLGTARGLDLLHVNDSCFEHGLYGMTGRISVLGVDAQKRVMFSPQNDIGFFVKADTGLIHHGIDRTYIVGDPQKRWFMDSKGNQWLSYKDLGILHTTATGDTTFLHFDQDRPFGLNSNTPTEILEDNAGNIWIGSFDGGVNFLDANRKPFGCVAQETNVQFYNNRVRSCYQDSEGDVWIGTKSGGMLSKYEPNSKTFVYYEPDPTNPKALNDDFIFSITEDRPGFLWVGTAHKGVSLFDKKTGEFTPLQTIIKEANGLSTSSIYTLHKDDTGLLWIGTGYRGLFQYDDHAHTLKEYTVAESGLSSPKIRAIYVDRAENMWVGTVNGLNLYIDKNDAFISFVHEREKPNSLSNNEIVCIYEDSKKRFWIGTKNGLNLMDRYTHSFKKFTTKDGLPSNNICGISEDSEHNLWLSTRIGICKFNPDSLAFTNYTSVDGLQDNEFVNYVYCKSTDGDIYFGGNNGFNTFKPEDIKTNIVKPQVVVSGFKIFNKEVAIGKEGSPLSKHITQTDKITLTYDQNVITFDYIALNYTSSSKNTYKYMVEGFDNDWIDAQHRREVTYTNLDPGKYVFKVKAANNDGVWNEEATTIQLTILPPPWKTWWAYSSYFLVFVFILLRIRNFYSEKIVKEKAHELDQQKLNFFINVSHEFRTPISLILNPANTLLKENDSAQNRKAVLTIHQSAHKLANLVNQFLDFRKLEFGMLPLQVSNMDVILFTKKIIAFYAELAFEKNIEIIFKSDSDNIDAWIDADKYDKILSNLLSNAIKFSPTGGHVTVRLNSTKQMTYHKLFGVLRLKKIQTNCLELSVEDFGEGISDKHISHVFDRFYSSVQPGASTGIGLSYVKSLVQLHHGHIGVESELGAGTTFTVQFPLGKDHFKQQDFASRNVRQVENSINESERESLRYELNALGQIKDDIQPSDVCTSDDNSRQLVLIVEDNKLLREQLKKDLSTSYKVKVASNGIEALESIGKEIPDLIVSDVMMPEMDGIELCESVKSTAETCHVPVILLTAKILTEHRILGYETGADDYISKPFDIYELKLRVKNILELRKAIKDKFLKSDMQQATPELVATNHDQVFIDKMVAFSLQNISNPNFTYNDLQQLAGMSRTSFYYKISSLTNMSPGHFLNSVRIKHATTLLLMEEHSIKEISYLCGFNSPSYFNRVFRKVLDQTPMQFLAENKEKS